MKAAALSLLQKSFWASSSSDGLALRLAAERRGVPEARAFCKSLSRVPSQHPGLTQPHLSANAHRPAGRREEGAVGAPPASPCPELQGALPGPAAALVVPDTECEQLLELLAQGRCPVS